VEGHRQSGHRYSYKDAGGVNGPVKTALIKKSGGGTFS